MVHNASKAVWAVTPSGARLAEAIAGQIEGAVIYAGRAVDPPPAGAFGFARLADAVGEAFHQYEAHIFVMATGIAVRMIAPLLGSKTSDPAVVAVDDAGRFAVSLLSGHAGGANALAETVAGCIGAVPVISTATDNAGVPAIDRIAGQYDLEMENPAAVKAVSMAFLSGRSVRRHDPYHILDDRLREWTDLDNDAGFGNGPGVFVDHLICDLPDEVLVLRPKSLMVGVGCNSGTASQEVIDAVCAVFEDHRLSRASIRRFATISEKLSEPGLPAMAGYFKRPLEGYDRDILAAVEGVKTPSAMVEKHMGVNSVCEAAAIRAAGRARLLVPKVKSGNVTVAVAAVSSLSSA
ncbi:MAG: cobalamin biosynthesis protein [Desulfobacterales bacterium]|nr:cobalamin biosynthesis protein [Desulfobacterales bacterium]